MDEALFYFRISQDPTGERLGVDRQKPPCLGLAARLGLQPGREYVDNDLSATRANVVRPAFEQLLIDLHLRPRPVIVWHTDRLIRTTRDLERVIETGVNIYAVHAGHLDLSTPAGRAVARTVTAWAQYEGEQKALRQRAASEQRAAMGKPWWPRRPFGYEMDCTINEPEAHALRIVYAQLLAGTPLSRLAEDLNEAGLLTNRGKPWTGMTLRPVLLNPRNAGLRAYRGEVVGTAAWPAIVPEETWRAAVRLLSDPSRRTGGGGRRKFLLTGVARCGVCDGPVKAAWRYPANADPYAVYICRRGYHVTHRVDWLDAMVAELVCLRLSDPEMAQAWAVEREADVSDLRREVVELREALAANAADYGDGLITRQVFLEVNGRLQSRLEAAEERLAGLGGSPDLAALVGAEDVARTWEALPVARRRAVVQALIERLVLRQRGRGVAEQSDRDVAIQWRAASAA